MKNNCEVFYTMADSSLGRLLAAVTPRGICAVSLGERDEDLLAGLRSAYPSAQWQVDGGDLGPWVQVILDSLAGQADARHRILELPLDVRASAFQQRVWQVLRQIPAGRTRTYAQVAVEIGQPQAVRAVARACATNPAALVIPCHRVVRTDGGLGGYRWGIARKRALLEGEAQES